MKNKLIVLSLTMVLLCVILVYIAIRPTMANDRYKQDNIWMESLEKDGFLNSPNLGIDSYIDAVNILTKYKIDIKILKESPDLQMPDAALDEFIKMVLAGAKSNNLGIRYNAYDGEIRTYDGRKFDISNVRLLVMAIDHFAERELTLKNIDLAVLLGKAALALGTQLSSIDDVDSIHLCGIACKNYGLRILTNCSKVSDKAISTKTITEMQQKLNKELEVVKTMPPPSPSVDEIYRELMKSEPNEKR